MKWTYALSLALLLMPLASAYTGFTWDFSTGQVTLNNTILTGTHLNCSDIIGNSSSVCNPSGSGTADGNNYTTSISFNTTGSTTQLNMARNGAPNLSATFTQIGSGGGSGQNISNTDGFLSVTNSTGIINANLSAFDLRYVLLSAYNTFTSLLYTNVTILQTRVNSINASVQSIGNWTLDKTSYSTTAQANLLYDPLGIMYSNVTNLQSRADSINASVLSIGNWTLDKTSYTTTTLGDSRWGNQSFNVTCAAGTYPQSFGFNKDGTQNATTCITASGGSFDPSGLYANITAVNTSLNLTIRKSVMQGGVMPDTSGNVWFEPASITQTNDLYPQLVARFKDTATNDTLGFQFTIPADYKANSVPHIIITWTTTATVGNATFGLKYNSASHTATLDPVSSEENLTLTNTASGTSQTGVTSTFNLTAANLAANDLMQMALFRAGNTTTDNIAADIIAYDVELEYTNR